MQGCGLPRAILTVLSSLTCRLEFTWVIVSSVDQLSLLSVNLWKFLSGWMLHTVACKTLESLYKTWVWGRVPEHLSSVLQAQCLILSTVPNTPSQPFYFQFISKSLFFGTTLSLNSVLHMHRWLAVLSHEQYICKKGLGWGGD